jgi:hypothetical protein
LLSAKPKSLSMHSFSGRYGRGVGGYTLSKGSTWFKLNATTMSRIKYAGMTAVMARRRAHRRAKKFTRRD